MALLESKSLTLGTAMPPISLEDTHGNPFNSHTQNGPKGLLVAFTCNHCPYAIAVWPRLIKLARDAESKGIQTVAINPNIHPHYPDDSPEAMGQKVTEWDIPFPYLIDKKQSVAKSFDAQCTPDIYLLNHEHCLVYHGRIDDNWQDESHVTREELRTAIDALSQGLAIPDKQYPCMGCSIKWQD